MKIDIIKNAKRNMRMGAFNRIVVLLCPFIERMVINNILGPSYLGLRKIRLYYRIGGLEMVLFRIEDRLMKKNYVSEYMYKVFKAADPSEYPDV